MIQVNIVSLSIDSLTNQPVIILRPTESESGPDRLVPIWIGPTEATAILLALQGLTPPRPMTHDLLADVVRELGAALVRAEITHIDSGTFYARLILACENGRSASVDARPSDSIALAVRTGSPVYLSEQVFEEASILYEAIDADESEETEVERFRAFIDHVDPSDFRS